MALPIVIPTFILSLIVSIIHPVAKLFHFADLVSGPSRGIFRCIFYRVDSIIPTILHPLSKSIESSFNILRNILNILDLAPCPSGNILWCILDILDFASCPSGCIFWGILNISAEVVEFLLSTVFVFFDSVLSAVFVFFESVLSTILVFFESLLSSFDFLFHFVAFMHQESSTS